MKPLALLMFLISQVFSLAARAAQPGPISWVADDYPAAVEAARKADRPLVIDLWAPWCHSCRSMQHTVLVGADMAAVAPRFVWLSMNTDTPAAAETTRRFPQSAWPTFLVVDPFSETVQARHVGTASPAQFRHFLDDGERAYVDARGKAGALTQRDPRWHMRAGDQAALKKDHKAAAAGYAKALEVASREWRGRAAARSALAFELAADAAHGACVELGLQVEVAAAEGPSAVDFVLTTAQCAESLPDADPRKRRVRERAVAALARIGRDPAAALSPDDRVDALWSLVGLHDLLQQPEAARKTALETRALLDRAASEAGSAAHAATFNMRRVDVYSYLGEGEALVPILRANVDALPGEYDPPARLARLLLKLKRPDEALAPAQVALSRVQGPRTANLLKLMVEVQTARGDAAGLADAQARLAAFEQAKAAP
jgi:thiol-disulfide isomerase/thioredoxin